MKSMALMRLNLRRQLLLLLFLLILSINLVTFPIVSNSLLSLFFIDLHTPSDS